MTPGTGGARGTKAEWQAVTARTAAVPAYLKTALANVRRGTSGNAIPGPASHHDRGRRGRIDGGVLREGPSREPRRGARALDAETQAALTAACPAAAAAFRDFRKGLFDLFFEPDGKALKPAFDRDRFAAGEAEYSWALKNNLRVTRTPRELHAYGKSPVAETLSEMTVLAPGHRAREGFRRRLARRPSSTRSRTTSRRRDAEMLAWYRDACRRLVEYGRKTGMFDLPADYRLDVVFTPPPLRDTIDAAYYPAPQFKKGGVGQFYVTPTGNDPAALREHARAAVASLAAHEGFPGHDWYYQFMRVTRRFDLRGPLADARAASRTRLRCGKTRCRPRDGRSTASASSASPARISRTASTRPEERLFQLQNQLLRDARVVVDTGIHCGFMSFDDAVTYFARNVVFVKGPVSTDPALNPDAAERAAVAADPQGDLPLLEVADAGDHVPPRESRDPRPPRRLPGDRRRLVLGEAVPRGLPLGGIHPALFLPRERASEGDEEVRGVDGGPGGQLDRDQMKEGVRTGLGVNPGPVSETLSRASKRQRLSPASEYTAGK